MPRREYGTYAVRTSKGWNEAIWYGGWFTADSPVDFNSIVQRDPKVRWFTEPVLEVGGKIR